MTYRVDEIMRKNLTEKRALNISEAAQYACISRSTLQNWIVIGLLPFEELPSRGNGLHKFRLIRRIDLDDFLDRNYHKSQKKYNFENPEELILLQK